MTDHPNRSADRASELLDLLPRRLDWLFARGRTRPDEPLYGCQIKDGDEIVSQTEHDDPAQCATLAIEGLRVHPCEYCHKKITGLPGNACENCMNSGLRYPEIEHMGGDTVETDDIKRFFDGMAAANRRSTHMHDVAQSSQVRLATIEECARIAEAQAQEFLSPEYASNQPLGSFCERFACDEVGKSIRALAGQPIECGDCPPAGYPDKERCAPCPQRCSAGNASALDNSQSLLAMIYHLGTEFDGPGIMPHAWESEGLTKMLAEQIAENRAVLNESQASVATGDALVALVLEYARDMRLNSSGGDDYPWTWAKATADYLEELVRRANLATRRDEIAAGAFFKTRGDKNNLPHIVGPLEHADDVQRSPPCPIGYRRMEFEAAERLIAAAVGGSRE
jgi:hypothetical protein